MTPLVSPSFARAMLSPFPYSLALAPRKMRRIAQRKRDYKRIFYRRALRHPAFTVDPKQTRYLHFRRCLRRKAIAKGFVAIGVGVWYDPGSDYRVTVSTAY